MHADCTSSPNDDLPAAPLQALLAALIDEIDTGVLVCNGHGRVALANWAAQQALGSSQRLADLRGVLDSADARGLLDAVSAATRRGRRQIVTLTLGGQRLLASVSPLPHTDGEPLALLLLGRRAPCSNLALELVASRYRLTLAERRVLTGLARGTRPVQLASDHGVAVCTVRTQVKSLHAKLGVNSNDGLIGLLAGVPPLASALKAVVHGAVCQGDDGAANPLFARAA